MKKQIDSADILCGGRLIITKPATANYSLGEEYEKADIVLQEMGDGSYLVLKNGPSGKVGDYIPKKEVTKFLLRIEE